MSARAEDETNTCIAMHCTVIGNEWGGRQREKRGTEIYECFRYGGISTDQFPDTEADESSAAGGIEY